MDFEYIFRLKFRTANLQYCQINILSVGWAKQTAFCAFIRKDFGLNGVLSSPFAKLHFRFIFKK